MTLALRILAITLVLAFPATSVASRIQEPDTEDDDDDASQEEQHAAKAQEAAQVAKKAAKVATTVAEHSVKITGHAKKALKHALGALHDARVETEGLNKHQKKSLKKAEAHLREATKKAEYGEGKKLGGKRNLQKDKMQQDLSKSQSTATEKEKLLEQVEELRKELEEKNLDDQSLNKALDDLEADVKQSDGKSLDELKAGLERLREQIRKAKKASKTSAPAADESVTPVQEKGIDIDTQMPFGELEPFGREDTAQELTESSIKESDEMVDQLERAEVAEEKRAVFRALTRLRGAAIASFDGVARSQTGNIDEYNKVNKWRKNHPIHHLADEESDVSKWAFPENADLLQK